EEEREDVRRELRAAVPDVGDGHVVADEQHERLDGGAEAARGLSFSMAPLDLPAGVPDRQEDQSSRDAHEDDMLRGRNIDAGDHPVRRQVGFEAERPLDHVAVRRVLEDRLADVGRLRHRKNLVSRKSSGSSTPRNPSDAEPGLKASRCVAATARTLPSASARTPIPPSHRAMNAGCGPPITGRSSPTATSCAASATNPPIPAAHPPSSTIAATNTAPSAASRRYDLTRTPRRSSDRSDSYRRRPCCGRKLTRL